MMPPSAAPHGRRAHRVAALGAACLLSLLVAPIAGAQIFDESGRRVGEEEDEPIREPWKGRFGLDFVVAQPVGEFADYVDSGFGGTLHVVVPVEPTASLALRVGLDYIVYGHETEYTSYLGFPLEITRSNNILAANVGAQVTSPAGAIRPYLNGTVGLGYFFTQSSLSGRYSSGDDFDSRTNYEDVTFAWTGGAGLYIPLTRGDTPVSLDLGARYHGNGRARYLREGSIEENSGGGITYTPIESETNLVVYQVGISVGGGRR
jgi:hypothetical protein